MRSKFREFEGVLARLDEPSEKPIGGSRGHRVVVTSAAAAAALPEVIGLPVDLQRDGFGLRERDCGVVTEAFIRDHEVVVRGYVSPAVGAFADGADDVLNCSFEAADAVVADFSVEVWSLKQLRFVGLTIQPKRDAGYKKARFRMLPERHVLTASAERE